MKRNSANRDALTELGVHPSGRTEGSDASGAGHRVPDVDALTVEPPRLDNPRPPVMWVLQQFMLERVVPGQRTLLDAATDQGYETIVTTFEEMREGPLPIANGACALAWGTHQFVKAFQRQHAGKVQPGSFHRVENLSYSAYSPYLGDLLLNDDFVLLPFGEVVRRGIEKPIFLKPDAVTKAFTGLVLTPETFAAEISSLRQIQHITDDVICVVASPKPIEGEFRMVVSEGRVVAGSEYRWDGRLDIRSDVHPVCWQVAQEVAQRAWQADTVYTCDVALSGGVGRVVELNTFSGAGLYACDVDAIVREVSKAAWNEHQGDVT